MFIFATLCIYLFTMCVLLSYIAARLLSRSQYPEGPANGHLDTGFFLVFVCLNAKAEMFPKTPS